MKEKLIGEIIQEFLFENKKIPLFLESKVPEVWNNIVGDYIGKQSEQVKCNKGILTVKIKNAALKFELLNSRSRLIDKINEQLGCEMVKDLIFK